MEELSLEQLVCHYRGLERDVAEELGGLEKKVSIHPFRGFARAFVEHPVITGSAVGFVSFIVQYSLPLSHRLSLFREDPNGGITPLPIGFGAYLSLALAKDYILGKRERIAEEIKNFPNRLRHLFYNNPVLAGLAASGAFLADVAYFSPDTLKTNPGGMFLFSAGCYIIGYIASKAAGRAESLRRGFERFKTLRPKNKPFTEIVEKCYNNLLWEKPWIRASLVATYSLITDYQIIMADKDISQANLPFLFGLLAIPAAAKGAAFYVVDVLGSNIFHTNNLYILRNLFLSRISEEQKNYRAAVKYRRRLLEVSPSKKFEFDNRIRLSELYLKSGLFLDALDEYGRAMKTGHKPKPKNAVPVLEKIREVTNPYSLIKEGTGYFRDGMFKEAELCFVRAIRADPLDELPHLFYSYILEAAGRKAESTAELRVFERIAISKGEDKFRRLTGCRNQVLVYRG